MKNKTIYLTGFMASGKSSVGPRLAKRLGYDFVDVDNVIENLLGLSISRIFAERGERHFRELEKSVLDEVSSSGRNLVVSLGGGTLTLKESRELVRDGGVLVYLKANPKIIIERLGDGKMERPMLLSPAGRKLTRKELTSKVKSLLEAREAHYLNAAIVVDTSRSTIRETVKEIATKLKEKIV